jgi:hypothetical protein
MKKTQKMTTEKIEVNLTYGQIELLQKALYDYKMEQNRLLTYHLNINPFNSTESEVRAAFKPIYDNIEHIRKEFNFEL